MAPPNLKRNLLASQTALRRATAMQRRAEAVQARADTRDWAKARRARTRELIELGGLVTKSGLLELVAAVEPDIHAVLLGALLDVAGELRHGTASASARTARATRWRERGRAAFRTDPERDPLRVALLPGQGSAEA